MIQDNYNDTSFTLRPPSPQQSEAGYIERCEEASHMAKMCECVCATKSLNATITCVCACVCASPRMDLLAPDAITHDNPCQLDYSVHI